MALADSITALGTAIINLVGTRLNRDANNFSTAGTQNLNNMIDSRIGAVTGAPVGTVIAYMGTDEPEGFLLMDGRELSRTTYAALFAVIGTSQGAGNGSTTFNIADMTDGRYLMGSTVAGSSQDAICANILGTCNPTISRHSSSGSGSAVGRQSTSGAFSCYGSETDYIGTTVTTPWNPNERHWQHFFDASLVSDIYSNDTDKLHPDRTSCKFFIRYM